MAESNKGADYPRRLPVDEAATEDNGCEIGPVIGGVFADERELFEEHAAGAGEIVPELAGDGESGARGLLVAHLGDGQVGDVRPRLLELEDLRVEFFVELGHAGGVGGDPYIDGGGDGDESLDGAESDVEGLLLSADALEKLDGGGFGPVERAWRQDGERGRKLREGGMQLP